MGTQSFGWSTVFFIVPKLTFALGLLLRILWWSQNGNHPENNFSQIWLHTKVGREKKRQEFFYIVGYLLELIIKNLAIWNSISSKFGKSGSYFFHEKSFEIIVFQVEIWQNFGTKKNATTFLTSKYAKDIVTLKEPIKQNLTIFDWSIWPQSGGI